MAMMQRGEKKKLFDESGAAPLKARVEFEMEGLDVSVFGLSDDRKLEDDRYLVFYNQPQSPRAEISAALSPGSAEFFIDTAQLPPSVTRLMFTATHDTRAVKEARRLVFSIGSDTFEPVSGLADERALMIAELYKHGGAWRLAAVGQGFNGGLKALLEYFGGEAAEDEPPARAAAPPQVQAPPPPRQVEPPRPTMAPPAPWPDAPPPRAPQVPMPPAIPATPQPQITPGRPVDLRKGQGVSLSKIAPSLRRVAFGLGWDPSDYGRRVDLDGSCIAFDASKKVLETVWFGHLRSRDGTISHSGDNLTGRGSGDDEVIRVDLESLPPNVQTLAFTINSFTGQRFSALKNAFCRVVDEDTRQELARYNLGAGPNVTGMIMAKVERGPDGWTMTALGEPAGGLTVHFLVKAVRKVI